MAQIKKNLSLPLIFIILIIALIYSWPFFKPGFFTTDDGEWAVVRLAEMVRELKDGQFPPRWSDFLNHGFGYPLFSFVYPFPFYLAALPKLVGISYLGSIKILFVLSVVLSGIFMFLFADSLSGPLAGFMASLFYISAPYRLTDLYVRGSLGEALSFALFPLILYLTLAYRNKPATLYSTLLAICLAILLLTHNVMALFFIPVWICFIIFIGKKQIADFFKIFILALSLSAFFVIPMIFEKKYLYLSQIKLADPANYFLSRNQVFAGMSLSLIAALFLSLFNLGLPVYLFSLTNFLLFLFLTQKISLVFWTLPPLNMVDFPFRAFALVIFFASVLSSFLAKNRITLIAGLILAVVSVTANFYLTFPQNFTRKNDSFYFTNDATTTSKDELMPLWVKDKPANRYQNKVDITSGNAGVSNLNFNSKSIDFDLAAETQGQLTVNTVYFPGWEFKLNGKSIPVDYNNSRGVITIKYPAMNSHITGRFTETPVRLFSDFLSLAAALIIIIRLIHVRKS